MAIDNFLVEHGNLTSRKELIKLLTKHDAIELSEIVRTQIVAGWRRGCLPSAASAATGTAATWDWEFLKVTAYELHLHKAQLLLPSMSPLPALTLPLIDCVWQAQYPYCTYETRRV